MRLFVDNLTNVDFSYLCPKRGLVGETWLANVEIEGELDAQGMVCDFGIVKKVLRDWLGRHIDHCLLVPAANENVTVKTVDQQITVSLLKTDGSHVKVEAPLQAISLVDCENITEESVADWCVARIAKEFGGQFLAPKLRFCAEKIETPYYHYSHGLKKHGGDCQRIAHGHRSRLEIWRNGDLCMESVSHWASIWRDIYIASKEDRVSVDERCSVFAYSSSQGRFSLHLPTACCYIIETDSTVEYIAQHLAERVAHQFPGDEVLVKAFEGIGKGAIAHARSTEKRR